MLAAVRTAAALQLQRHLLGGGAFVSGRATFDQNPPPFSLSLRQVSPRDQPPRLCSAPLYNHAILPCPLFLSSFHTLLRPIATWKSRGGRTKNVNTNSGWDRHRRASTFGKGGLPAPKHGGRECVFRVQIRTVHHEGIPLVPVPGFAEAARGMCGSPCVAGVRLVAASAPVPARRRLGGRLWRLPRQPSARCGISTQFLRVRQAPDRLRLSPFPPEWPVYRQGWGCRPRSDTWSLKDGKGAWQGRPIDWQGRQMMVGAKKKRKHGLRRMAGFQ